MSAVLPATGLLKLMPTVWLPPVPQSPLKVNASGWPWPCTAVTLCAGPTGLPSTVTVNCASPWLARSDRASTSVSAPVPTVAGEAGLLPVAPVAGGIGVLPEPVAAVPLPSGPGLFAATS